MKPEAKNERNIQWTLQDYSKICKKIHLDEKCISEANSWPIFTYDPPNQSLEPPLQEKNSLVMFLLYVRGLKMAKKCAKKLPMLAFFCHF